MKYSGEVKDWVIVVRKQWNGAEWELVCKSDEFDSLEALKCKESYNFLYEYFTSKMVYKFSEVMIALLISHEVL